MQRLKGPDGRDQHGECGGVTRQQPELDGLLCTRWRDKVRHALERQGVAKVDQPDGQKTASDDDDVAATFVTHRRNDLLRREQVSDLTDAFALRDRHRNLARTLAVAGERLISAAEGNGPVNALDVALRKDLGKYQKYIEGLKLIDYRVRILNGGTEAVTRVLIESEDEAGESWITIGVSPNIIDASFQALMDSVIYKLVKSGAPA